MQKIIGLMGYVNKSDFVINLAKVLDIMGKKVLVIDGTVENRLKYTVPKIEKDKASYITNYDRVDYAIGFKNMEDIKTYLCNEISDVDSYDIVLIDIDNIYSYENFRTNNISMIYFFMEYTNISIAKNKEILQALLDAKPVEGDKELVITKVLFRNYITRASVEYYENKTGDFNVLWTNDPYELPYDDQDRIADIESQQSGYIELSKHTKGFENTIIDMTVDIIGDATAGEVKKILKTYVRGRA